MSFFDSRPLRRARPPPSRKRVAVIIAVYAAVITFGAALFTGSIPGFTGHISSNVEIDGRPYYSESYFIPEPKWGSNTTPPSPVVFYNVTFWLWVTGWDSGYGSYVHGNGTEPNGTAYPFVLGGLQNSPTRTSVYVSPDSDFAVAWSGEFVMQLMVEVPPA